MQTQVILIDAAKHWNFCLSWPCDLLSSLIALKIGMHVQLFIGFLSFTFHLFMTLKVELKCECRPVVQYAYTSYTCNAQRIYLHGFIDQ